MGFFLVVWIWIRWFSVCLLFDSRVVFMFSWFSMLWICWWVMCELFIISICIGGVLVGRVIDGFSMVLLCIWVILVRMFFMLIIWINLFWKWVMVVR